MTALESALEIARKAEEMAAKATPGPWIDTSRRIRTARRRLPAEDPMTDPIPAYESTGSLTVCPCCGGGGPFGPRICRLCWDRFSMRGPSVSDDTEARAEWARIGVELRREGKLPPLREPERWGVWCETSRVDQCGWYFGMAGSVRVDTTFSSREKAQEHAELMACTGDVYTVKPYPDAKQTSETLAPPRTETAPPLPAAMHTGSPSAEGGAAKVERCGPGCTCVYCGHRLAGERRRAELVAERPKWVTRLAEVTDRLAVIDRELDRLDRTGEVK